MRVADALPRRLTAPNGAGQPIVCNRAAACWQGGERVRSPATVYRYCDIAENGNFQWTRLGATGGTVGQMRATIWLCVGYE